MRHLSKLFLALAVLVVGATPALAKAPWEYCPDGTTYGGFFIRDGEYWIICNTGGGGGMSTVNSPFVKVPITPKQPTGGVTWPDEWRPPADVGETPLGGTGDGVLDGDKPCPLGHHIDNTGTGHGVGCVPDNVPPGAPEPLPLPVNPGSEQPGDVYDPSADCWRKAGGAKAAALAGAFGAAAISSWFVIEFDGKPIGATWIDDVVPPHSELGPVIRTAEQNAADALEAQANKLWNQVGVIVDADRVGVPLRPGTPTAMQAINGLRRAYGLPLLKVGGAGLMVAFTNASTANAAELGRRCPGE